MTDEHDDIDRMVDELMAKAEEIGREFRDGADENYPPGVDPERLRELFREGLRNAIISARSEVAEE